MNSLIGLISANYNNDNFGRLTTHRPIASIPFGSRYRLLDFSFSNMINSGITSVGLITPHLYRSIMDHLGSGKEFGLSRKNGGLFILPGSTYGFDMGKGKFSIKDIKGNMAFLKRNDFERVVVTACNTIININYEEVEKLHIDTDSNVTLVYKKVELAHEGEYVIEFSANGKFKTLKKLKQDEKNVNLFLESIIIDKKVLMKLVDWYKDYSYIDLLDAIIENASRLNIGCFEFNGYAKTINCLRDYVDASKELLDYNVMKELFMSNNHIHTKSHDAPPAKYTNKSKVVNSLVGTGTIVNGQIENSIVFRDCIIEEGAVIKNSIIMQKCIIKKGACVENVIAEKGFIIDEGIVCKGKKGEEIILSNE